MLGTVIRVRRNCYDYSGTYKKIDNLSKDEYQMVEVYVDNVMEYSRHRKKDAAWQKMKSDLMESEKRMREEGGISSGQLRKYGGTKK